MKKQIVLVFAAVLPSICSAQKWDLRHCIDYALEHNIQVKQAGLNIEMQRLGVNQSKFDFLPNLNGSVGYNASFGRSLDPTTYQFVDDKMANSVNSSLSVGMPLFGGLAKHHSLQKSKLNLMAAISDAELLKNDISLSVAAAYLQILFNKEQVTNSENQIKVLENQLDIIKKKIEAGSVAIGTQLELESQLANEKYNLVTNKNTLSTTMLDLAQLLELRDSADFDIVIPDVSKIMDAPIIANVETVNDIAQGLPQIKSAELRLKVAEQDVKLARAQYYPSLSMGASYGSSYSDVRQRPQFAPDGSTYYEKYPFWDQYSDNASSGVSVSMQIPIFNGLKVRRSVNMSKLGVMNSDYSLQLAKDKLYKQIQQAHSDAVGALSMYRSALVSVTSSQESLRNVQEKFEKGAATPVDYTVAKNAFITAQSKMLQAKYQYIFRIKILDFYQGIPLSL